MDPLRNAMSGEDTLARLRGLFSALSPSEKKVGQFVLDNPENVIYMTLAEIANRALVSDATAVRFCRSIGYEGWLEFKIALTRTIPHSPQLIHKDISILGLARIDLWVELEQTQEEGLHRRDALGAPKHDRKGLVEVEYNQQDHHYRISFRNLAKWPVIQTKKVRVQIVCNNLVH